MFSGKIVHTPHTVETIKLPQVEVEQPRAEKPRSDGEQNVAALTKSWWPVLLRGVAAIIFGVLAFGGPGLTLLNYGSTAYGLERAYASPVLLFGAYALVDGALALIAAFTGGAKSVPN
jgi:uncharacterized membrane protein HdeD (DUF308 family)